METLDERRVITQRQFVHLPVCPSCGARSEQVSGEFEGYIEGYRVTVLECCECTLRFSNRMDVPAGLYDMIYAHTSVLPGYDRYATYASAVTRHPQALDYLASSELCYWFVRDHVQNRLPNAATVIDLGCGEGYLTYALRQAGVQCVGVDLSATAVRSARDRFGHRDWFFTVDELAHRGTGTADLVIALELIEHVPDPVRLLSDALAMLKEGGSVLMTTPNRDASATDSVWDTDLPPVHLLWFGAKSMTELAVRAGCDVTFPAVPRAVHGALGGGVTRRHGTWPALLTDAGEPTIAVRRARSLPWRARRRVALSLTMVSGFLDQSPFRQIPRLEEADRPATLGACFTSRTNTLADRITR